MRRGWLRRAYRAVAVVVLCSLAAFQLEALIADVCDGDATPEELVAFGVGTSDLPSDAVAIAAARATPSRVTTLRPAERVADGGAAVTASGAPSESSGPGPLPAHGAHACHCVHAHGGVLPRLETVTVATVAMTTAVPLTRELVPPSVTRQPRLRPPLA